MVSLGKWIGLYVYRPQLVEVAKYSAQSVRVIVCGLAGTALKVGHPRWAG